MATYTVEVASITSRAINGKFGPATAYDLVTTTGKKVSYGFKNPGSAGIGPGVKVTFEGAEDKYGIKPVKDTMRLAGVSEEVDEGGGGVAPAAAPRATGGFSGGSSRGSFPIAKNDGQIAIIRQNSLTNAVNFMSHLLQHVDNDQLTIEELVDRTIDLAYKFTEFSSGGRETAAVEKMIAASSGSNDLSRALTAAVGNS